jgi:predicted DNA-binding protein
MCKNMKDTEYKKQASIRLDRDRYDFMYSLCEHEERTPSNLMSLLIKSSNIKKSKKGFIFFEGRKARQKLAYSVPFRIDKEYYEMAEKIAEENNSSVSYIFYEIITKELDKLIKKKEESKNNIKN